MTSIRIKKLQGFGKLGGQPASAVESLRCTRILEPVSEAEIIRFTSEIVSCEMFLDVVLKDLCDP
jgi:hypothetical protein